MKQLSVLVLLFILASCEEKPVEEQLPIANVFPDFNYVLDTVFIDAGDEQIYLEMGLKMDALK